MKHALAVIALMLSLGACAREPAATPASTEPAATPAAAAPAAPADAATPAAGEQGAAIDAETSRSDSALERIAALPPEGKLPAGRWVAGQHYRPLVPAQPTNVGPGKVEVVEVFWYGCPHCLSLEPFIASWMKNQPAGIEFVRLPVIWGPVHKAHAQLFYTLQALGRLDQLHQKVFEEIQRNGKSLAASAPAETLRQQVAFARANGISEADYTKTFQSFAVQTRLQQAEELARRYKVEGVPLIIINGKYVSDVGMAGSQANLISLINDLAASEKRR